MSLSIQLLSACMCSTEAAFFLSIMYCQQVANLLCFTYSRSSEKRYYKGLGLTSFCHVFQGQIPLLEETALFGAFTLMQQALFAN